jgi:hypothetical protein
MNLRQIIRNQKLINFNLLSLIKEEALSYEEYVNQEMPGLGNKMRKISTILQYKGDEDFSSHPKKEQLYNQALQNLQLGIESGKVKLSSIPEEFRKEGLKRKSPEPKETPQAAPDEEETDEEDFDDELKTMQGFMADQPMPDEEEADDEGEEKASRDAQLPSTQERKKLFQQDAENTDKALNFTKADVARQKAEKGKKDVGLGTPESRAGEAVTHRAMRMLKEGKSYEEVRSELMKIADKKDTVLTPEWVDAGIRSTRAALRAIGNGDEQQGIDNIEDIVWDTDQGREAIGVGDHGTSADMFVRTKDGQRIGISLKKDGKVFLANKGYPKEMASFANKLRKAGIPEDQIESFMEDTSVARYDESLQENLINSADAISKNKKLKSAFAQAVKVAGQDKKAATDQYIHRIEEAGGIQKFLKKFEDGSYKADDVKALSRVCQFSDDENLTALYDGMRNEDAKMMQRMMESFKDNPAVADGFKEFVLEGIHFESILDLDQNPELDNFLTIYGEKPDGVELSKENLLNLFGSKTKKLYEIDEQWQQTDDPKEKEKLRKQIAKEAESKIYIDYKEGAKNGIIKVKGEDGSEYPLFTIQTRSRGIGTSPILEIAQTTFMTNALKNGSFNVEDWSPKQRRIFYQNRRKELMTNIDEGALAPITKKALEKELAAIENKLSKNESIKYFGDILDELKQNTLGHHWMKAEEDYPVHYFIREINKESLN